MYILQVKPLFSLFSRCLASVKYIIYVYIFLQSFVSPICGWVVHKGSLASYLLMTTNFSPISSLWTGVSIGVSNICIHYLCKYNSRDLCYAIWRERIETRQPLGVQRHSGLVKTFNLNAYRLLLGSCQLWHHFQECQTHF